MSAVYILVSSCEQEIKGLEREREKDDDCTGLELIEHCFGIRVDCRA